MAQDMERTTAENVAAIDETDTTPWYAIKLYTVRQQTVAAYFAEHGLETFIPEQYVDYEDKEHHIRHELRPVVRNLIFLKKTLSEKEIRKLVISSPLKMSVVTKEMGSPAYCEIPAKQMFDFKMMCNPELTMKKFLSTEQAHLKKGDKVLVHHGPLKGLTGRLVRSNKKYYLLKEIPGMAIMVKVSRWCCEAAE